MLVKTGRVNEESSDRVTAYHVQEFCSLPLLRAAQTLRK
jgi:hypothetical protein